MRTILLTGATGFIGKHLLPLLHERGHRVLAVGRHRPEALPDADFLSADLLDANALARESSRMAEADVLIHLAAAIPQSSVPGDSLEAMRKANVTSTRTLLDVLPPSVRHIVFASTLDVYGSPQFLPVTEEHPLDPLTAYGRAKVETEELLRRICTEQSRSLTILRLTQIYGPGEASIKAIPRFMDAIAAGTAPTLFGDGSELRDYLYVADAARAFALAVEKETAGTFTIASGSSVSVRHVLELLLEVSGSPLMPVFRERQKPRIDFVFDTGRAQAALAFTPTISLHDGLQAHWNARRGVQSVR